MSAAVATAAIAVPEFRAAGIDLSERRRSGVSRGSIVDLTATPGTMGIDWAADGSTRIGAFTTIAAIASDARIRDAYPGIAAAAQGLGTPQIRHLATLGGNLAQRSRCWYFRNPQIGCLKKGGSDCPARSGNHLYHAAFDLGPCVAPHPSTMAAALLAYDAKITTDRRSGLSIRDLLGDGSNGAADHLLAPARASRTSSCRPHLPASAPSTSAPSAAPMRNGRWSKSARAPCCPTASSSTFTSPPAASPRCRCH